MAFNPNDPQQVQAFRESAIRAGGSPQQVDAYIVQKQAQAVPQAPVEEPKSVTGFIKNVIGSGARTVGDIGSAIVNVVNPDLEKNTLANAAKLGLGTIELAIPGEQGLEKYPKAVGEFYKNRYGSLKNIGETLYNDPVGALLDASVVADLGGSALGKVGELSKIDKLVQAGKTAKGVGEIIDPLRLATKGVGKVVNPQIEKLASKTEDLGKVTRQGVSKIYMPASVYGAGKEAKVAEALDRYGAVGSAQAKYEKLQPIIEDIGTKIDDALMKNPVPIEKSVVESAIKDNLASTIRTSDLTMPQAQKMVDKYLSDLTEIPVEKMTSQDLFPLKQIVNGDTTRIYDKLDRGIALTPKEQVILTVRDTLDQIIAKTNPEVKALTKDQSYIYDAVDSLNRSRKTTPTMRIAGTTVPAGISQTGQDIIGKTVQSTGEKLRMGEVPEVGLTPVTKGLVLSARGEPLQNTTDNTQGQITSGTGYGEINNQTYQGLPSNPANVQLSQTGSVGSISQPITQKQVDTRNPFGASPSQIYEAWMKTSTSGNKKKAAILRQMYEDEVKYQAGKATGALSSTAAGQMVDAKTAINMTDELDQTIKDFSKKMGPISGKAAVYNPYDVDAQTFQAQMTSAAQIIGKYLEGGVLRAEDTVKYQKILPQITDTPAVARNKIKNVKALLEKKYQNQQYFYQNVQPDVTATAPAEGGGNDGLGNIKSAIKPSQGLGDVKSAIPKRWEYR